MSYNLRSNARRLFTRLSIDRVYTLLSTTYDKHYDFSGECHGNAYELTCVLSGNLVVTSGPDIYECSPYELVIIPPDVFHAYRSKSEFGMNLLNITFSGIGADKFVPSGKFILTEREKGLIDFLADEIRRSYSASAFTAEPIRRESDQIIKNLLETLCLSLNLRRNEAAVPKPERSAVLFGEVVDYLQSNVDRSLTISTICNDCGVGVTTLKMIFRTYTGVGIMKYYNHLRARRAAELIESGVSLTEIAQVMNFSSQNYFSTFFYRETGQLPSKYRQDFLEEMGGGGAE